eukprot:SAG31_NODE_23634_length_500_cov_0.623441_1_plen_85_part_10
MQLLVGALVLGLVGSYFAPGRGPGGAGGAASFAGAGQKLGGGSAALSANEMAARRSAFLNRVDSGTQKGGGTDLAESLRSHKAS